MPETATVPSPQVEPAADIPPDLATAVRRADQWARDVLGRWAGTKAIYWVPDPDGSGAVELRLTENGHTVTRLFSPADLGSERVVTRAVSNAWGRLLRACADVNLTLGGT